MSFIFILKGIFSIPAEVEDISNEKYFPFVLKAINEAKNEIKASLYYISYYRNEEGKVTALIDALGKAVERKVNVEVVLDRGFEDAGSGDMSKKNIRSFSVLKNLGIKTYYDDIETLSHSKYLIIDDELVITGSFNWSESSLGRNRESALAARSKDLASQYETLFDQIPKFIPEPVLGAIPIPREFIRNKNLAAKMVTKQDPRLFDFYLWIQKKSYEQHSATVHVTLEELYDYFYKERPVKLKKGQDYIQRFMNAQLRFYKKSYPFIKDYERNAETKELIVTLDTENKAEPESLYLSKLYWEDGWNERLMHKSEFSLLYMLDKTESGRMGRYFEQERWDSVHEYGVNHEIFAYGLIELQRYNLIEKDINWEEGATNPNGYTLNDFYKLSDFQNKLKKLESKTDPEIFKSAMTIADLVNEPHDYEAIKELVDLGNKYGNNVLKYTIKKIKPKGGLSRYRRFHYVIGLIKSEGDGKT